MRAVATKAPVQVPATEMPPGARSLALHEMAREHGALVRQLGALQRRVGDLLRSHADTLVELQCENVRLRAELVVLRSAVFWGLGAAGVVRRAPARAGKAPTQPPWLEAQAVICQTGCVGHAHPWLGDHGQCRRTGQACAPLAVSHREREP